MNLGMNEMLMEYEGKLALSLPGRPDFKPFFVDFTTYLAHSNLGTGGRRLLLKALCRKNKPKPTVFDATGGWARDAFYLAQQGLKVRLTERVEVVFALLQDAYQRGLNSPELAPILARIELIHADAKLYLAKAAAPEVIYLDPMFPERRQSAQVKKDLQLLQDLPETEGDDDALFLLAQQVATHRVVVKRPCAAPFLGGCQPSFQYQGKTVRFDVYQRST